MLACKNNANEQQKHHFHLKAFKVALTTSYFKDFQDM